MERLTAATPVLEKRLLKLEGQVQDCFPLLKGCVTTIGGEKTQPKFSSKKHGKTTNTYLGKNKEPIARKYLENYHRLNEIVDEMTEINLELIRRLKVPRVKKSA